MPSISIPAEELTEFDLPRVCVVTGQTENVEFKPVKFAWYPRWISALVIINLLLAGIVAHVMTRKVQGSLPFTEEAYAQWRRGRILLTLSLVATVGLIIGGIALLSSHREELGLAALVASIALPVTVGLMFVRNKGPAVEKIADGYITLRFPSPEAVRDFEERLRVRTEKAAPRRRQSA